MKKILCMLTFLALGFTAHAETNAPGEQPTASQLSDREIAKVLLTINDGEIDAAQMASRKSSNDKVKDFAKMMIAEHKKNISETKSLAKKNKIDTKDSDLSKTLKEDAKTANKDLKKKDKADFDKEYISQQIAMHEKALDTLKNTLIPNAKNPEFKEHLEKTQMAVTEHLDHAKKLRSEIQ